MRRSHLLAILAATLLAIGVLAIDGIAQQGVPPRAPTGRTAPVARAAIPIALLDVPKIFKQHTRFKQLMNGMKTDFERAQADFKLKQEAIQKLAERLKDYRKGTPDYKALAEEITRRQATLAVNLRTQKEDFAQQEGEIFYKVYTEMLQVVDYYARSNGIAMVLKFNSEPADVTQPQSVVPFINKRVVWHAGNLDITPVILNELQRRYSYPPSGPAGVNPGPVGVRPPAGVAPRTR